MPAHDWIKQAEYFIGRGCEHGGQIIDIARAVTKKGNAGETGINPKRMEMLGQSGPMGDFYRGMIDIAMHVRRRENSISGIRQVFAAIEKIGDFSVIEAQTNDKNLESDFALLVRDGALISAQLAVENWRKAVRDGGASQAHVEAVRFLAELVGGPQEAGVTEKEWQTIVKTAGKWIPDPNYGYRHRLVLNSDPAAQLRFTLSRNIEEVFLDPELHTASRHTPSMRQLFLVGSGRPSGLWKTTIILQPQ